MSTDTADNVDGDDDDKIVRFLCTTYRFKLYHSIFRASSIHPQNGKREKKLEGIYEKASHEGENAWDLFESNVVVSFSILVGTRLGGASSNPFFVQSFRTAVASFVSVSFFAASSGNQLCGSINTFRIFHSISSTVMPNKTERILFCPLIREQCKGCVWLRLHRSVNSSGFAHFHYFYLTPFKCCRVGSTRRRSIQMKIRIKIEINRQSWEQHRYSSRRECAHVCVCCILIDMHLAITPRICLHSEILFEHNFL